MLRLKINFKQLTFLAVFLFLCFLVFVFLCFLPSPPAAHAADINFQPQIEIPGFTGGKIAPDSIGLYIKAIYKYAIGIVGILAAVVLMFGGLLWLTAGGNTNQVGEAKAWIGASLTGLLIALCSFMIMATINPKLVEVGSIDPGTIKEINLEKKIDSPPTNSLREYGCCDGMCNTITTKTNCTAGGGTWKDGSYDCNSTHNCVQKDMSTGCCSFDINENGALGKSCVDRLSLNVCKTEFENSPVYSNVQFDINKSCAKTKTGKSCVNK